MAFVDHFDRGSPDVLGLALLHLPSFFPPAKQLLDTSSCGASDKQQKPARKYNSRNKKTQPRAVTDAYEPHALNLCYVSNQ